MRVLPHRQRKDSHAGGDRESRVEFALQSPHERHRECAREGARQNDETRLVRREIADVLEIDGQHKDGRVQAHAEHQAVHDADRQLPALEDAQVDDGLFGGKLVPDERDQRERARNPKQAHLARREPVQPLAALEHRLEGADSDSQQPEAHEVDSVGTLLVTRIGDERQRQRQREHAEGDVDVEDPRPAIDVGDPAADGRPQRRAHHHADAKDGHGGAVFFPRELLVQNRL